ncbi:ParB/RepB/Spo0J family partition protein [Bosea sp. (in: a-proteobacteria)]|uniref:ParB/RepB/Spo0J family partition protein n=1 Tax=Bosea sp. (in: a-proteobacteria) TaxID=1871050 RepID=UPI00273737D3|nr:ParB/RepB/Spo0J family partition protein [Bosea sp. (in: a-proteobacteria)]MDP3258545.1 ParB/RepB/Spo0J family partition protein [Bosea sp. (in: a-proteobacteria)]
MTTTNNPTIGTLATTIQQIALSKLVPSKANVRKVNSTAGIGELADSIEAHGLIQNLTVRKAAKGQKFEVVAGARRLAALRLLAKEGRFDKDIDIPCNVLAAERDAEISLAENTQREAMHVVDEVLAYQRLVEEGLPADAIASRFGQSVVTVRQRLKLAALSPQILEAMRADEITIEQARALAITDDHAAQEAAWFGRDGWSRSPGNLRAALTSEHIRSTDRLARFIGIEAYEASGGAVLRDLFFDNDATFLTDRPLAMKLATEILQAAGDAIRLEGWKWMEISIEADSVHHAGYDRIHPQRRDHTEAEHVELAGLGESYDALVEQIEAYAEGDPQIEVDEVRLAEIEQRIEAIRNAAERFFPDEQALAGCLVAIGYDGALQVTRGLVRTEDRAALDRFRHGDHAHDDGDETPALPSPLESEPSGYSATLIEELTAIRTAALRVELAQRPEIAMAAMLHPLVLACFYDRRHGLHMHSAVEIRGERKALDLSIRQPEACRALSGWTEIVEAWAYRLPGDLADLWQWLIDQPIETLTDLLAVVSAANLNAVTARHEISRGRIVQANQIAQAVNLDMRSWWSPEREFLSRLSKSTIAGILREAGCSEDAAKAIERSPKAEAVAQAERELDGKGWLPSPLTMPVADRVGELDDRDDDAGDGHATQMAAE